MNIWQLESDEQAKLNADDLCDSNFEVLIQKVHLLTIKLFF